MADRRLFILLFIFPISLFCQTEKVNLKKPTTIKYAGIYSYGKNVEKGRIGTVIIYPETDSTILFYLDLNRGAPSYNMGAKYGRISLYEGHGIYTSNPDKSQTGCSWNFRFSKNKLVINNINGQDNCGFGYGVFADGTFKRKSKKMFDYFEDMEENKIYFKKTAPEKYYQFP